MISSKLLEPTIHQFRKCRTYQGANDELAGKLDAAIDLYIKCLISRLQASWIASTVFMEG
jgi:hypothetical protein